MNLHPKLTSRFISALILLSSCMFAATEPCASEIIDIYLSKDLSASMVIEKGNQLELNIPKAIFKGLGQVRPNLLKSISIDQKANSYQIILTGHLILKSRIVNSEKGAQIIIKDHACVKKNERKIIVIDAGHGGKDPGAIGVNDLMEKDVTLAVANALAQSLSQYPHFSVFLTRSQDEYISLRGRISLAQKHEPDLFISIHADSAPRKTAEGMSVYALSVAGATSEQAKYLADKHNNELTSTNNVLDGIIFQLTQRASIVSSIQLGAKIIASAGKVPVHINHVEQAAFVVLKAFDIPSVLVEIGFLSSPEDARRLSSAQGQRNIVAMIESGIFKYFDIRMFDYVVSSGDTIAGIARKFNQSVPMLLKLNPQINPHQLKVGSVIKIEKK